MKRSRALVMALSLILCMAVGIGLSYAYFTDYEEARGGAVLKLGGHGEIDEQVDQDGKTVSIRNTGETDMVVRVLFFGKNYSVNASDGWTGSDNTWYYSKILKPGEATSKLTASVEGKVKNGEHIDFDVTVVHEAERVVYTQNASGKDVVKAPAGWSGMPAIAAE